MIPSQETVSLDDMQREVAAIAESAQTLITAVHTDVDNITGDTRQVLANVNDLTGEANRRHVAQILANTDAMIARTSPQIDRIATNVETLTAKMGPTVDNVNSDRYQRKRNHHRAAGPDSDRSHRATKNAG